MDQVRKHINDAYRLLSGLTVNGDAVDLVAACKTALRLAFQAAAPEEETKAEEEKEEG